MQNIYTIGYEGLSLEAFLLILRSYHIQHLIDVRRNPISRKPGFSKHTLSQALSNIDIQYTHLVELGTPTNIRNELKITSDYEVFFKQITAYMRTQGDSLRTAIDVALHQNTILLCFERNPNECHRSVVASEMSRRSNMQLNVEHVWL